MWFVSESIRSRLIAAATDMTFQGGWSTVTMARLADRAGVSRQTVYNEVGSKQSLAEAMILTELGRFLDVVEKALDAEPTDLVAGVRQATRGVLTMAQDNPLLHAVVSASHGADTELLPLLTTHSEALVQTAKDLIASRVKEYEVDLAPDLLDAAIDMLVRVVLSHVMQPSDTPAATADRIATITEKVLRAQ